MLRSFSPKENKAQPEVGLRRRSHAHMLQNGWSIFPLNFTAAILFRPGESTPLLKAVLNATEPREVYGSQQPRW